MIERVQLILKAKNITASKFADEIGVQRSSVSHILSGRNNPSLDVIQKILKRYPDINTEWLLSGKGPMVKDRIPDLFDTLNDQEPNIFNQPPVENEIFNSAELKAAAKMHEPADIIAIPEIKEADVKIEKKEEIIATAVKPTLETKSMEDKVYSETKEKEEKNINTSQEPSQGKINIPAKENIFLPSEKQIDKIVIFYTDRTFSWYSPSE